MFASLFSMIKSFSKLLFFCHLTASAQTDEVVRLLTAAHHLPDVQYNSIMLHNQHMTVHHFPPSNTHYIFLNRDVSNKALKQKQSDISVLVSLQTAKHN